MSSLENLKIKDTYPGLIKTENNTEVGLTASRLTDGKGNQLPIILNEESIAFDGDVDFTYANVIGLDLPVGPTGSTGPAGPIGATGPAGPSSNVSFTSTISGNSVTGTTNETISRSVLIPANSFSAGDWLILREFSQKSGTSGTATTRVYLNTVNNLSGALLISTISVVPAAAVSINSIRNLMIKTTNGSGSGTLVINPTTASSNYSDWVQTTTTSNTLTSVSINWGVDLYLIFTCQLANANDTIFNSGYSLSTI